MCLDTIDSLPQVAQGKLLRFLQDREYRPVGSNTLRRANVRVAAASNRELTQLVGRNQFRQDLYVTLAPLRQRREDIPMLAAYFARRFAALRVSSTGMAQLQPTA